MKKIIITLFILIFIGILGYKIMMNMKETNEIEINFNVVDSNDLNDLRVNLYVMRADRPSEWYGYYKYVTVIDKGKVLIKFKSKYVVAYEINGHSTLKNYYFDTGILDNVFTRKEDFYINYFFTKKNVGTSSNSIFNIKQDQVITEYSNLNEASNVSELEFHDPRTTGYQISDISEEDIFFLETKSFNELKNVEKIQAKDIFKLDHLTYEEKLELVKIHDQKKFDKPLE